MVAPQCFHHPARESVARCPECRRCFCRECITEHEGRVLCADCLARLVRPSEVRPLHLAWLTVPLTLAAGLASAWLLFYALGWALVRLPAEAHDGTLWRQLPTAE